jgi:hypothetical protein
MQKYGYRIQVTLLHQRKVRRQHWYFGQNVHSTYFDGPAIVVRQSQIGSM